MKITVQFEAQLRHVAGVSQACVDMPDGSNVQEALQAVASQFGPALSERVLVADGTVQRSVLLFLNEKPVAHNAVTRQSLSEGDVLMLYPPISGG